mgnify:CR=1 FL=1
MKICYLANTAIPSTNASAIQIVKTCESFSKLNHKVFLITTRVSNKDIFDFYNVKSKFECLRLKSFTKFPLGIKFYLFSIISIFKSMSFKPDLYITRNFFTCFLLVLLKKKVIVEIHHDLDIESRIVRYLVRNIKYFNSKYILKIIAISNFAKNSYIKKYSVDKKKFIVLPSGSSIVQCFKFSIVKKKYEIGYLGSMYKSRGFDLLVNLAKIDKNNNYHLYGSLKNVENLISKRNIKNLFIYNHIPYAQIPKVLSKMDFLLMPYTSNITAAGDVGDITNYTSPLKLFDYLSAGKIILCSDYKVLREVINKNNAIFVKNFKNIYSWKNEIHKLCNQPQKRFIISRNNYNLSKSFTLLERAKKILKNVN